MALPVSSKFTVAQAGDSNQIASRVYLVLGDYANGIATAATIASSGDFSSDYPAVGAINGDRTELNIGPASGADDGIGKSSWKSSVAPDTTEQTLEIDFHATHVINRVKLYHRLGHGLSEYKLEYWDGSSWQFAQTTGVPPFGPTGYGDNPYGDEPYGGVATSVTVTTTLQLDVIDFPDATCSKIKLTIYATEVAGDKAEVVAIEAYRLLDITSRVKSVSVNRARDFKLNNNLAATCSVTFINEDRFFSRQYVPTALEVAAGFVNSELRTGLGLIVKGGHAYGGADPELVTMFVGTLDSITTRSISKDGQLSARDGLKGMLDLNVTTRLKTNLDLGECAHYLMNLANISDYELAYSTANASLDYFFVYEESIATVLQKLSQACADGQFYFDENGIARFNVYSRPASQTDTLDADFAAGNTLTNISSYQDTLTQKWTLMDDFSDGDYTTNQLWSVITLNGGSFSVANLGGGHFALKKDAQPSGSTSAIDSQFPWADNINGQVNYGIGSWDFRMWTDQTGFANACRFVFYHSHSTGIGFAIETWIYVEVSDSTTSVKKRALRTGSSPSDTTTTLITTAHTPASSDVYRLKRNATTTTLYINGSTIGTAATTDTSAPAYAQRFESVPNGASAANHYITDIYFSRIDYAPAVGVETSTPEFISQTHDLTANLTGLGIFQVDFKYPAGTQINYYIATSTDDITYSAWLAVVPNAAILSPLRRFLRWRAVFTKMTYTPIAPIIQAVTVNYFVGTGAAKYHTSVDFTMRYDGNVLDLTSEMSDSLSGDSSVVNSASVKSSPTTLTGTSTDQKWQGTAGTPAAPVSGSNTLTLTTGDNDFQVVVPEGMDISLMTGANPAAAVVTFGTATGSWTFATIHPTKPVLRINITSSGTLTALLVQGKGYTNANTPVQHTSTDSTSIAQNGVRSLPVSNDYIINANVAVGVATRLVSNYKDPFVYIPSVQVRAYFNLQLGDRITLVDENSAISADYNVVSVTQSIDVSESDASATSDLMLVKIP